MLQACAIALRGGIRWLSITFNSLVVPERVCEYCPLEGQEKALGDRRKPSSTKRGLLILPLDGAKSAFDMHRKPSGLMAGGGRLSDVQML